MKNNFSIFAILTLILFSCSPSVFYQVYNTAVTGNLKQEENSITFNDENCTISYNFWANEGQMTFKITNNSDSTIYINMDESFFIMNGIAYDYYLNRTFESSVSTSGSVTKEITKTQTVTGLNNRNLIQTNANQTSKVAQISNSNGYSVSYTEEKVIGIPAKSAKIISEYSLVKKVYRDCDLLRYPTRKNPEIKNFTLENSPVVFSNCINYSIGKTGKSILVRNEFYVNQIQNLPESEMFTKKNDQYCGQMSVNISTTFKNKASNMFYITYPGGGYYKH